jgi:hypothetical protein
LPGAFDCLRVQFVDPPITLRPVQSLETPIVQPAGSQPGLSGALPTIVAETASQVRGPWASATATAPNGNTKDEKAADRNTEKVDDMRASAGSVRSSDTAHQDGSSSNRSPSIGDPKESDMGGAHQMGTPSMGTESLNYAGANNNGPFRSVNLSFGCFIFFWSSDCCLHWHNNPL